MSLPSPATGADLLTRPGSGGDRARATATDGAGPYPAPRSAHPAERIPQPQGGDRAAGDAELLAAHVAGDREAFAVLYARHRQVVFRAAWSVLRHHQDTEDAVQDAFTRAAHHAGRFRGDAAVSTWLRRIAINTALSQLVSRRRLAEPVEPTHDVLTVERWVAAGGVEVAVLEEALLQLSYRLRESFFLHVLRGFTASELAVMLGIPRDTVLSRVRRAKVALAVILAEPPDAVAR
ncbi:RNA polymerase sigma factor [Actinomycetospora endophytica]|uniref:RNA polymerase sigma factor n=1 Tax=Actinomycetospora endophytica TaxID=2291215 RepID=A0ABS8P1A5_9PSEU|nr:RNA polymerase sigma factor [Actinomycetospora endophytica]MCD2192031.1 RNA polymerase sigma factor [Actinomycetospora endophytica]